MGNAVLECVVIRGAKPSSDVVPAATTPALNRAVRRWEIAALLGVLVVVMSYLFFVQTVAGQALENAALRGADQIRLGDRQQAFAQLNLITVYSLAVTLVLLGALSLYRKRLDLAVASVGSVVVALAVVQALKRFILTRPALVEAAEIYRTNSFPSGHTTIAMAVLLALITLSSQRSRGFIVFLGTLYALGVGAWTLTAKWHRFSDTLGAEGVVLTSACLASIWLARRGAVQTVATERGHWTRWVFPTLLSLNGLIVLASGLYLVYASNLYTQTAAQRDYVSYVGLSSLASAGSVFTALLFWMSWQGFEVQ